MSPGSPATDPPHAHSENKAITQQAHIYNLRGCHMGGGALRALAQTSERWESACIQQGIYNTSFITGNQLGIGGFYQVLARSWLADCQREVICPCFIELEQHLVRQPGIRHGQVVEGAWVQPVLNAQQVTPTEIVNRWPQPPARK